MPISTMQMSDNIERARQHVEEIRKQKFSIGVKKPNPLTKSLHHVVTNFSAQLYSKDLNFLMELIQNAEENKYLKGVEPTLEFVLTSKDITRTGAPATLLVFNNEVGFSRKNMDSFCSIGKFTRKRHRHRGFIGEKGIGFKSVFHVSAQPHIFSNGYQVRFNELPHKDCGVRYIVPEWIDDGPCVSDMHRVYGMEKTLPETIIILPLKPKKVDAVKKQLSQVQPEVLLFLCKIKRLSIWEYNGNSVVMNSFSPIAAFCETEPVPLMSEEADARIVHLSLQEEADLPESKHHYYIWREVFPVKPGSKVDGRKDIGEWVISLAFPFGERLKVGIPSTGIFAFHPTAMVTNFPFIVQADFMLTCSRESILLDNKWNLGILACVPSAFVNAIISCMNSNETARWFLVAQVLKFFPARESPFEELNRVRESIKTMLQAECIIPCESFSNDQKTFCHPTKAVRILPEFRKILFHVKEQSVSLNAISSLGNYVLHTSVDCEEYNEVLDFIGVPSVQENYAWYVKCIQTCDLMSKVSINVYMELLFFLADNWSLFPSGNLKNIPFLRYISRNGKILTCSVSQVKRKALKIHLVLDVQKHAWLNKWNVAMGCPYDVFFLPDSLVSALVGHERQHILKQWLFSKLGVVTTSICQYCSILGKVVTEKKQPKLAVSLAHLVYHSQLKYYIGLYDVFEILRSMPIVDRYGKVRVWTKTLVPASGSKWAKLFGVDYQFAGRSGQMKVREGETESLDNYVDLGAVYSEVAEFAGESTREKDLLDFLTKYTDALDLPNIPPKNVGLRVAHSPLTSDQAILLLDWIRVIRTEGYTMPPRLMASIQNGKWMKTYSGFDSPTRCFLCDGSEESPLLEMGNSLQLFSLVDQEFYSDKIRSFKDELKLIGVQIGFENMHQFLVDHLKGNFSNTMGREWGIFVLQFVKHSKVDYMLNEGKLNTLKREKWLKTNQGYSTPVGSILLPSSAEAVLQITDLPIIDKTFYDDQIDCLLDQLKLLGVVVDLEGVFTLIPSSFKFPKELSTLKSESVLLILRCIRHLGYAAFGLIQKVRDCPWMKTHSGFRCPSESILYNKRWDHLSKVIPFPIIDKVFYGDGLNLYKAELKSIGVVVDLDEMCRMISDQVKLLVSSGSLTSAHVISILYCMKCMGKKKHSQLLELRSCFLGEKWLKTSQGYRYTSNSVLFDSKWGTVTEFVELPLIDEVYYGNDIYLYKDQLKMLGVVVDFSEGAHFVARGLSLPKEPASMTADTALSLLQCVRSLRINSSDQLLLKDLLNKLQKSKWLKTHMGYKSPEESLLLVSEWECYLDVHDAPFIDQSFYGNFTSVEKDDLRAVGVKTDTDEVCSQIFEFLHQHTQSCVIVRIYKFLDRFKWNPRLLNGSKPQIWIPDQFGEGTGKWVDSRVCVLHDSENLFYPQLQALDRYYKNELLPFFKLAFGVAEAPSLDDYVKLWNDWERNKHAITPSECSSFWEYISQNWNSVAEKILKQYISMTPATTSSGEGIQLVKKEEVCIPDDLQLKNLFTNETVKPLFVWYPKDNLSSLSTAKLFEIYASLGVRKISEAVQYDSSTNMAVEKLDSGNKLIGKAFIKIVLGFLANPRANMPVEGRQKIANALLNISVFLSEEPIFVSYRLQLTSPEKRLVVKTRRLVLRENCFHRLILDKSSWKDYRNNIEFVTEFARAVSEVILPNNTELVANLCKIIQIAFAFGMKEEAVDFLLVSENLELSAADQDFLDAAFSPNPLKRLLSTPLAPEYPPPKKTKQELDKLNI